MKRTWMAVGVAFAASWALVSAAETPRLLVRDNAPGCVTTALAYGGSSTGSLGVSDCTFSDGTYYDRYTFTGNAGDLVTISVRPLSTTLTNPLIVLASPAGDASLPPQIYGATATELTYKLSSSGTWAFAVGTHDVFATGNYFVKLAKVVDDEPTLPQSCVVQYLQCHQTGLWSLGAQSCRFSQSGRAYADFSFYGVAGDVVTIKMTSVDFPPQANIYSETQDAYLGVATFPDNFTSTQLQQLPETGYYDIITTSRDAGRAGFFSIQLDCTGSGCVPPLFITQPVSSNVGVGGRTSLSATANGSNPLSVSWVNAFTGEVLGTGASIQTPKLFETTTVHATAHNACGDDTSDTVILRIVPSHPRAVRH